MRRVVEKKENGRKERMGEKLSSSSANIYPRRHKDHPGHLKNDLPPAASLGTDMKIHGRRSRTAVLNSAYNTGNILDVTFAKNVTH